MKEYKSIEESFNNSNLIPEGVALDVSKRISDWILSGGKESDDYINRQLKYASYFLNNKTL